MRVMVEVATIGGQLGSSEFAAALAGIGLTQVEGFVPVPMRSGSTGSATTIFTVDIHDASFVDLIRQWPTVVNVYADTKIAPFDPGDGNQAKNK